MEAQRQQVEEYEKQRQQQIEQAKKFKEEKERKRQEAQKKASEEDDNESEEEESEDAEGESEETDEENEGEEEGGPKVNTKKEMSTKEAEKRTNEQAKKDVQKTTAESTKTPNLQPIKRQDGPLLGATPRAPGGKTSPAVSLPSIGAVPSPTKGNSLLGGRGGLSPSVGDSLKGATVGRAGLLPLGKGKKSKGTWRRNKAFTSRSHGN